MMRRYWLEILVTALVLAFVWWAISLGRSL